MNSSDLESKLKSVPVPERSEEYWNDFPSRIRVQLRREQSLRTPRSVWRPRLAWAGGLALAVALMWVGERFHPIQTASAAIVLTIYDGLNHAEAAQVLNCSETTVSWRIFAAKQKLKRLLTMGRITPLAPLEAEDSRATAPLDS